MRTVRADVPYQPGHVPLALVEWDGYQWLVMETEGRGGLTVLERGVPDDQMPTAVVHQTWRWSWPPAIVACCAVFLFLALVASIGERLHFADVVGVIIGFVILVLLLDRRQGTP